MSMRFGLMLKILLGNYEITVSGCLRHITLRLEKKVIVNLVILNIQFGLMFLFVHIVAMKLFIGT